MLCRALLKISFSDSQSQHVKKSQGGTYWENKNVSSRREKHKFPVETVHKVPSCTIPLKLKNEWTEPLFKNNWVLKTRPAWTKMKKIALLKLSHALFSPFVVRATTLKDWHAPLHVTFFSRAPILWLKAIQLEYYSINY